MTRAVVQVGRRVPRRPAPAGRAQRVLRDVRSPLEPDLRLEQIIVCHSGVHVVTSADAREVSPGLRATAHAASDVVRGLLPQRYRLRVRAVLVRPDAEPMADLVGALLVTTPDTLTHIVRSSPVVLSTSEIRDVALRLEAGLEPFPTAPLGSDRHRSRRRALAVAAATAACAGTAVLLDAVGAFTLPW